jgi:hypothetical protein
MGFRDFLDETGFLLGCILDVIWIQLRILGRAAVPRGLRSFTLWAVLPRPSVPSHSRSALRAETDCSRVAELTRPAIKFSLPSARAENFFKYIAGLRRSFYAAVPPLSDRYCRVHPQGTPLQADVLSVRWVVDTDRYTMLQC